jgi:phytoene desaturase
MPRDTRYSARQTAVVAGAGFGGIAAALRLRAKGYEVHLIDRCPRLGGRGQVFEKEGFRHDAGPTVLTAPQLFEELFALFGKSMADYVTLVQPDPWYRFYYDDGETFDYGPTEEATEAEIARLSPNDVDGYRRMGAWSKKIYDIGFTRHQCHFIRPASWPNRFRIFCGYGRTRVSGRWSRATSRTTA